MPRATPRPAGSGSLVTSPKRGTPFAFYSTVSMQRRRVVMTRAIDLGHAAHAAEVAGDHRRAAELYRAALLLLQRAPVANSDGFLRFERTASATETSVTSASTVQDCLTLPRPADDSEPTET
jgi:hypothetical protein